MNKFYPLAIAAMLGIGAFAVPGGSASATALLAVQQTDGVNSGGNILLQEVAKRRNDESRWDRKRHGDRFRNRRSNYRHYYDGYYYSSPWWTLTVPLSVYDDDDDYEWGDDHVQWCSERYRSYNLDDNTWVAFSGQVRECESPF
ncbi:MAG: BA14K family protein [Rhizobiales bacterium]|nr:BA14K family protein [Hyphomicrobiales bacterium]